MERAREVFVEINKFGKLGLKIKFKVFITSELFVCH